jgi:putative membrane protein
MTMHPTLFLLGIITLAVLWLSPWSALGVGPFSTHMIVHIGLVALAAPLIVLGIAGTRFDPVARFAAWFPPIQVSMAEFLVVWGWHTPLLHHAARHSRLALVAEQSLFLITGLWLWFAVLGGAAEQRRQRAALGIIALLLTSIHMTLLGALLVLAPRALFGDHAPAGAGELHLARAALDDQHTGGTIMLIVGGISYLAGGLGLTITLLRSTAVRPRVSL